MSFWEDENEATAPTRSNYTAVPLVSKMLSSDGEKALIDHLKNDLNRTVKKVNGEVMYKWARFIQVVVEEVDESGKQAAKQAGRHSDYRMTWTANN